MNKISDYMCFKVSTQQFLNLDTIRLYTLSEVVESGRKSLLLLHLYSKEFVYS